MSTKYWDLYVYYVKKCVRENYINDIDPNHYEMEWNHFWPQSIFGNWPVGQWLTKKQHAIASALQTLVFKENCMCGWHKSYIPTKLLELAWPFYCEARRKVAVKIIHEEKDEFGRSVHAVETLVAFNSSLTPEQRKERGKKNYAAGLAFLSSEQNRENGRKGGLAWLASLTPEQLKASVEVMNAALTPEQRRENGKKVAEKNKLLFGKKVIVTFPDGSQRFFPSIRETSLFLGVSAMAVIERIRKGPSRRGKLCGIRFEPVEEM